jgi:hypothetical protein
VGLSKQEIALERKGVEAEKKATGELRRSLKDELKAYKEQQKDLECERQRTEIAKKVTSPA